MTDWDDILKPAPVYCDGCHGPITRDQSLHREYVKTALGRCHRTTHIRLECIEQARRAVNGQPVKVRETGQDKVNTRVREG